MCDPWLCAKKAYGLRLQLCASDEASGCAYGWDIKAGEFDWLAFRSKLEKELDRLEGVYRNLLKKSGVKTFDFRATVLKDKNTVLLSNGKTISAKNILIATGGRPFIPNVSGSEYVITSNEVFDLPEKPNTILIVGGGYIACEFACILNGLGVVTTQFYRGKQILRGFDEDVQNLVADEMKNKGINLCLNNDIKSIEKTPSGYLVKDILCEGRKF